MPTLNKKVVLFNGPPGAGKDTMVSELVPYLNFQHMKFAAPIKRMAAGLLDMSSGVLERSKDLQNKLLNNTTLREMLIGLSEEFLKPRYGEDIFGRLAVEEAQQSSYSLLLFSDCGFTPEVQHVIRAVGHRNCLLIRLHRAGKTYDNDSR